MGPGFFDRLPVLRHARDTFDAQRYRAAPDEWALAVTDIVDSTGAIADGRHKTVNFVAAMAIAAAKNLCAPESIPFLFGGDGAVLMVPPPRKTPKLLPGEGS
jgi:GTP cyclohydrolase III